MKKVLLSIVAISFSLCAMAQLPQKPAQSEATLPYHGTFASFTADYTGGGSDNGSWYGTLVSNVAIWAAKDKAVKAGATSKPDDMADNTLNAADYVGRLCFNNTTAEGGLGKKDGCAAVLPPVQGPCVLEIIGATSADGERYIGLTTFNTSSNAFATNLLTAFGVTVKNRGVKFTYTYDGTDKVSFVLYSAKNYNGAAGGGVYVYDVKISAKGSSGFDQIKASKEVANVEYYTVLGQKTNDSAKGIVIEKTIYADGTSSSAKVLK